MTHQDIIHKLSALSLPAHSYVVVGSGILAALQLREVSDIDLIVSPQVYAEFKAKGWKEVAGVAGNNILVYDVYEMGPTWNDPNSTPNLDAILQDALYFDSVPFANPQLVMDWKQQVLRPKDQTDIQLLQQYLTKNDAG